MAKLFIAAVEEVLEQLVPPKTTDPAGSARLSTSQGDELECRMDPHVSYTMVQFHRVTEQVQAYAQKHGLHLQTTISLDLVPKGQEDHARISIIDLDNVKAFCRTGGQIQGPAEYITKTKGQDRTRDLDEYGCRFQLSKEQPIEDPVRREELQALVKND